MFIFLWKHLDASYFFLIQNLLQWSWMIIIVMGMVCGWTATVAGFNIWPDLHFIKKRRNITGFTVMGIYHIFQSNLNISGIVGEISSLKINFYVFLYQLVLQCWSQSTRAWCIFVPYGFTVFIKEYKGLISDSILTSFIKWWKKNTSKSLVSWKCHLMSKIWKQTPQKKKW